MMTHILTPSELAAPVTLPVAVMEATAVSVAERVGGRHIMPVAVMVAPAVCGTGGCKPGTRGSVRPH